jgi:hypothetical protein
VDEPVHLRSFRHVFRTDWRISRILWIDLTRLNPDGLPAWPVAIFAVLEFVAWLGLRSPFAPIMRLPGHPSLWWHVVLPVLVAWLSTKESPDGRNLLVWVWQTVRCQPHGEWTRAGQVPADPREWRSYGGRVAVRWDGSSPDVKPAMIGGRGPVRATFVRPVRFRGSGRLVAAADDGGVVGPVVLMPGERMEVRS